jgi:outer membrane protein
VASYGLLSAMGRLSAASLGLPVPVYDPVQNYDRVANAWFGR